MPACPLTLDLSLNLRAQLQLQFRFSISVAQRANCAHCCISCLFLKRTRLLITNAFVIVISIPFCAHTWRRFPRICGIDGIGGGSWHWDGIGQKSKSKYQQCQSNDHFLPKSLRLFCYFWFPQVNADRKLIQF